MLADKYFVVNVSAPRLISVAQKRISRVDVISEYILVVAVATTFFALSRGQGFFRQSEAHLGTPVPHTTVVDIRAGMG